jgi:hypothetical protein
MCSPETSRMYLLSALGAGTLRCCRASALTATLGSAVGASTGCRLWAKVQSDT